VNRMAVERGAVAMQFRACHRRRPEPIGRGVSSHVRDTSALMLDATHRGALRAVAGGAATEEHAAAVRNLSLAGLVQPVDGAWTLTQTGHAVMELECRAGGATASTGGGADIMTKIRDWFMT
jgi:hypothetical protein